MKTLHRVLFAVMLTAVSTFGLAEQPGNNPSTVLEDAIDEDEDEEDAYCIYLPELNLNEAGGQVLLAANQFLCFQEATKIA